jgi:glycosidase
MKEDIAKTKMALGLILVLPRIPQILYGTEILMEDSDNPGNHGLIRTDFPGGWDNDKRNAFNGKNLDNDELEMQNYLKTILNFRKNSKAIHEGETMHFAPVDGVYLISRKKEDEIVLYIVNKNNSSKELSLERFSELGIDNMFFKEIYSGQKFHWKGEINLEKNSSIILRNY